MLVIYQEIMRIFKAKTHYRIVARIFNLIILSMKNVIIELMPLN